MNVIDVEGACFSGTLRGVEFGQLPLTIGQPEVEEFTVTPTLLFNTYNGPNRFANDIDEGLASLFPQVGIRLVSPFSARKLFSYSNDLSL